MSFTIVVDGVLSINFTETKGRCYDAAMRTLLVFLLKYL